MYGERKGAAYGLAGLVKGLGILYLKQLTIMSTLQDAIQNKKKYRHREGKQSHCNTYYSAPFSNIMFLICSFRR